MGTVPWAVTCGHHWAGKQSGLCQDFTPTVPAQRRRAGRRAQGGRPAWPPTGGLRQRTLVPGITSPVTLLPPGEGIQVSRQQEARVCCSLARGRFPLGHNSGPPGGPEPSPRAEAPDVSVLGSPARQSLGAGAGPRTGSKLVAAPSPGSRASTSGEGGHEAGGGERPGGTYSAGTLLLCACRPRAARVHAPGELPRRCDTGPLNVASTTVPRSLSLGQAHLGSLAAGTKPGSLFSFSSTST